MISAHTLARWHRRIGIVTCLGLLLLAITGLALLHSHKLGLDKPSLNAPFWYRLTDTPEPKILGNEQHQIYQVDNQLITAQGKTAYLDGPIVGLIASAETIIVAEANRLHLFTTTGELVDTITPPTTITVLGKLTQDIPGFQDNDGDTFSLDWWLESEPRPSDLQLTPGTELVAIPAPEHLAATTGVSIEQVMLSLHNGRAFGRLAEPLMTAIGLLVIALSTGGLFLWFARRPKPRRPSAK